MTNNRATIYSNGIADFQRVYLVTSGSPIKISIPVKQQHLADVLASLTISGNVKIVDPPSFQPENLDDGNVVVSPLDSFTDLAHKLAGADVEISIATGKVSGRLVGTQDHEAGTAGEPITEQSVVVWTDEGLVRLPIRQIEKLHFTDQSIRTEISKSLNRSLREIKPNSTFVDLELSTNRKKSEAIVQYTIPAAAWKISYRLIFAPDSSIEFQGHAIVDNNTDEDWKNFIVAVVMGQPITFSTDIAESKTPHRGHVNVVPESAQGSIEIEPAMAIADYDDEMGAADALTRSTAKEVAPMAKMKRSARHYARESSADIDSAAVMETGDFCIFESATPVSIEASRSAIIPMFQNTLAESKSVLHFKLENHAERPFQAIHFHNSTAHSLSRGVCAVYDQQTYVGNCILPATQPGGTRLLAHALETAVRVRHLPGKIESRRIAVRISAGVAHDSFHKLQRTEYAINSHRDEPFTFVIDHTRKLIHSEINCQLYRQSKEPVELKLESLNKGCRVEFEIWPNDVLQVVFVETCMAKSQVRLVGDTPTDGKLRVAWLVENLVDSDVDLAHDLSVRRIIEMQKVLDEKIDRINHANDEFKRLNARQHRLRENIKAGVGDHQTARWQDDLARAEDYIVQLEEEHLPDLVADRDECRRSLYAALSDLVIQWNE